MNIITLPPDPKQQAGLIAWKAYQDRRRQLLVRRMIPWSYRKWQPEVAQRMEIELAANLKRRSQLYMRGRP